MTTRSLAVLALLLGACGGEPFAWEGGYEANLACSDGACDMSGCLTVDLAFDNPETAFVHLGAGWNETDVRCAIVGDELRCDTGLNFGGGGFYATALSFTPDGDDTATTSRLDVRDTAADVDLSGTITLTRSGVCQ
jgi:hypothetical protein